MAFENIPGLKGQVFVPEENNAPKKYPCSDCFACQMCSDARCTLCLKRKACTRNIPMKVLPDHGKCNP